MKKIMFFGALLSICGAAHAGAGPGFTGELMNAENLSEIKVPEAAPPARSSPTVTADISGTYKGNGLYGDLVITPRGDGEYYLKTCKKYKGYCMAVGAGLRSGKAGYDSFKEFITVYYGDTPCTYKMTIHLSHQDGKIWLDDNSPAQFPKSPKDVCPDQKNIPYRDYVEPETYTLAK